MINMIKAIFSRGNVCQQALDNESKQAVSRFNAANEKLSKSMEEYLITTEKLHNGKPTGGNKTNSG